MFTAAIHAAFIDAKKLPVQSRLLSPKRMARPETVGLTQVLRYRAMGLLNA
ncbi:MAG: hypothetical protein KDB01_01150 [Planctomycetaceae bacterium]|nr:hypothetical protein [Planctomycetaceae bacterium]